MRHPVALALLFCTFLCGAEPESIVLVVTMDGMRWQEVFGGADETLMPAKDEGLRREFLRETPQARREVLLPFLWNMIAAKGQIFGNQKIGSVARLTNGKKFSYPGYQELLAGFPDPRIDSNHKVPNPNVSVLEWLNRRPAFAGKVAAFGTWDVLPYILNRERSGLYILAGSEPIRDNPLSERQATINDLRRDTIAPWGEGNPFDSFAFHAALDYLRRHRPRVLYLQFGETDEWAHQGDYRLYLRAAQLEDRMTRMLWESAQSIAPGKVSLVLTTDHGRGSGEKWKIHGEEAEGAEDIWIAVAGPDVPAIGERSATPPVTQGQVAATVARLAGEDYAASVPQAAAPLPLKGK
jgi:hypothetical protein